MNMRKLFAVLILCASIALTACHKVTEEIPETVTENDAATGEFISPVYAALSEDEKAVYDHVKDAVADFRDIVTFDPPVSRETVRKIYKLVYSQERQYFWLSNLFLNPESEVSVLKINYLYSREDAEMKRAELDMTISVILGELPENASDVDKAVYFHDRIVKSCKFDLDAEHSGSAYGVLVKGAGQCEGYAAAFAALCTEAGIPNFVVFGKNSEGESHAWNKILLDGEWYNADCTWDDPIIKRDDPDFVRHDYLLVKDSEIEGKTHFTDELYTNVPACEGERYNYFAAKGLLFNSVSEGVDNFAEQIKTAGLAGKREAEIRFADEESYYAAMARLFDNGEVKQIIEDVNGNCGTRIRSAYKHNNDDMRIVHISLIYESDPEGLS